MGLLRKTISRQMNLPNYGERPEWATLANVDNAQITKKTLVHEVPYGDPVTLGYNGWTIVDGEQGWYLIEVGGAPGTVGQGGATRYVAYLHPGTKYQMWGAQNGTTGAPGYIPTNNCLGGTSNGGGGAGMNGVNASCGGGAGFIASVEYNAENSYYAPITSYFQTAYGYSNTTRILHIGGTKEISLAPNSTYNKDGLFGWSGVMTDSGTATNVVGLTRSPIGTVGQEITLYDATDLTVSIGTYIVTRVTKTTVFISFPTPANGNDVFNDVGTYLGTVSAVGSVTTLDGALATLTYSSSVYIYEEGAKATYDSNVQYYAWNMAGPENEKAPKLYYSTSSTNPLAEGSFLYELCNGEMVVSYVQGGPQGGNFDTRFITRVPSKDTKGKRVVFGTASRSNYAGLGPLVSGAANTYFGYNGTGTYLLVLAGGGSDNSSHYGGGALGRSGTDSATPDSSYQYRHGPAEIFGRTGNTTGAWAVVDMNDGYTNWGTGGNSTVVSNTRTGYARLYKLAPADETTKYSQRIDFPETNIGYSAQVYLNDRLVFSGDFPVSSTVTQKYILDVKQGDEIQIRITDTAGNVTVGLYEVTTYTIAFGLVPSTSTWKEQYYPYTTYDESTRQWVRPPNNTSGDYTTRLFLAEGSYAAKIVSGGGAGGGAAQHNGGGGETSKRRNIRFTNPVGQLVTVNVGAGGLTYGNTNGNGGASNGPGTSARGGDGGHPSYILFENDVIVESHPMRLYSWTNGSTVYYTRQSYPRESNKVIPFVDENGNFVTNAYSTIEANSRTTMTAVSSGLKFESKAVSNNPNLQIDYSGPMHMIYNEGTGGGGGAGGATYGTSRYAPGGGGGGGGGYYRVEYELKTVYSVSGQHGAYGGTRGVNGGAGTAGNRLDLPVGETRTSGSGTAGQGTGGGAGASGYGASGGAGGAGANHGTSYGGTGGSGTGGSKYAGDGARASNPRLSPYPTYTINIYGDISKGYQYAGQEKEDHWGLGGTGSTSSSINQSMGMGGEIWIYRFDEVESIDDAGSIGAYEATPITQEFWITPYIDANDTVYFYVMTETEPTVETVSLDVGTTIYASLVEAIAVDSGEEEAHGEVTYIE